MKKAPFCFAVLFVFCLSIHGQATFPQFGSIDTDEVLTLNRFNLGWTKSITLTSTASRGITFDPRLTYNSFVWQKANNAWKPLVDGFGNPTWGWITSGGSFQDTNLTYKVTRFRCVANDGSNQWTYGYYNFRTSNQTFDLNLTLAEVPEQYPECSGTGEAKSVYGVDSAGSPTGYLLVIRGNGGPMPWPNLASNYANNNLQPIIFAPGGTQVDLSGSVSDNNGNTITVPTDGGNPSIWKDSIGRSSLTINNDTNSHLTTYAYPDTGGNLQTWTMHYGAREVRTNFGCANTAEYAQGTIYLPSSLDVPGGNGSYTFEYEATPDPNHPGATTGRMSKMTLPSGGYVQFAYTGINCDDGSPLQLTKTINDGSASRTWTYVRTKNGDGTWKTSITTPTHSLDIAFQSNGLPTDEKTYAAGGGSVVQEVTTTYSGTSPYLTTVVRDGISQSKQTSYDMYGNLGNLVEYDWNSTTSVVRSTITNYMGSPYTDAGLVNLPSSHRVIVGGNLVSRTEYFYDNKQADGSADSDPGNIAMVCRNGAAAHDDQNYGCSSTSPRGNLTKVVQYADADSGTGAITTHYGYDSLGNRVQSKDGRGNSSYAAFDDKWDGTSSCAVSSAFAYPTGLTDALGHSSTNWYNRCTGQLVKSQDPNSQTTTVAYNDPLLRVTGITYPDNTTGTPSVQYAYPHNSGSANLSVEQRVLQKAGVVQLQTTSTDGLGRAVSSVQADPQGDDIVAVSYDTEGRQRTISNPYRSGATPDNTTYAYDELGRQSGITYPDGNSITNTRSQNTVTVGGSASSPRTLTYNVTGTLAQVQEPNPAGGSPLTTTYQYDGNDNLKLINQQGSGADAARTRSFTYDSLSRLIKSQTPEAGPVCYGQWTGANCVNGYDENGNLRAKTDARGITVSYTYDSLNRPTSKGYSDGVTPGEYFTYDVAPGWMPDLQNVIGRLSVSNNAYGGSTTGKATAATYSYDALGRVVRKWQQTPSLSPGGFFANATYDLAGDMISFTYPDGPSNQRAV